MTSRTPCDNSRLFIHTGDQGMISVILSDGQHWDHLTLQQAEDLLDWLEQCGELDKAAIINEEPQCLCTSP